MSVPVVAHPLGWIVLGAAGFLTYKAGKKAGLENSQDVTKTSLSDRMVKGAMKTVYKTQKNVSEAFGKTKEKYGTMWSEAREEAEAKPAS